MGESATLLSHFFNAYSVAAQRLSTDCFWCVFFDLQIVDDEGLAVGSIFTHIERKHVFNRHTFANDDWIEADVLADEVAKLVGRDFTQTFEASDLRLGLAFFHRRKAFLIAVAVAGDLLVTHAK